MDCASKNPVDLDEIYQNDCFVEAVVFVRGHATIIGGVAVAIASIMVCLLMSSSCHIRSVEIAVECRILVFFLIFS